MDAKKLKLFAKGAAQKPTFGTNPFDPWSTKANISEDALSQYLLSRGINPEHLSMPTKVAHAKSSQFIKWKQDHMKEEHEAVKKPLKKEGEIPAKGNQNSEAIKNEERGYQTSQGSGPLTADKKTEHQKAQSHYKEIKTPRGPGSQNEETINELKKSTLASYVSKASKDIGTLGYGLGDIKARPGKYNDSPDVVKSVKHSFTKRIKGVEKAANRLSKEQDVKEDVEQINELKKSTLASYVKGAMKDREERATGASFKSGAAGDKYNKADETHKDVKREKGIDTALGKLTKEDAVNEMDSQGYKGTRDDYEDDMRKPQITLGPEALLKKKKVASDTLKLMNKIFNKTHKKDVKEETVNEVSSELLDRYKTGAKKSADAATASGQHGKALKRWSGHMKATGKQIEKTTSGIRKALNREDVGDPQAAVNADGLSTSMDRMQSEKVSKSAQLVKSIYKKKVVKEDLYDHEKEDKSVATYGKKPKHDKADEKDSKGENKPKAAAVLSGGTTLTGSPRDTVEIDPMMRLRPGQPDPTKKDDKKKDDKKDEFKKDK
jgi:hypothetical protein